MISKSALPLQLFRTPAWQMALLLAVGMATPIQTPIQAQDPRSAEFSVISLEQGLSQGSVRAIVQDRLGFMWFGSQDGLNRYDGNNITIYRHNEEEPASLSNNFILAIALDSTGQLWIGTRDGVSRMDPVTRKFTVFRPDSSHPANGVAGRLCQAIHVDPDGSIWVGTSDGGASRFDPVTRRFTTLRDPTTASNVGLNDVRAIYRDHHGTLWLGTAAGLAHVDLKQRTIVAAGAYIAPNLPPSSSGVNSLYEDRYGVLHAGTSGAGLIRIERIPGRPAHLVHEPVNVGNFTIQSMLEDSHGTLWVAVFGRGLEHLDRPAGKFRMTYVDPHSPKAGVSTWTLYNDASSVLWVGSIGSGVARRKNDRFGLMRSNPEDPETLSSPIMQGMMGGPDGKLWIGTPSGLNELDPVTGVIRSYRHDPGNPHSLSNNWVFTVYVGDDGIVWVGTWDGGIDLFNPRTGTFSYLHARRGDPTTIPSDAIRVLKKDHSGTMWVLTYDHGLGLLDPKTRRSVNYRHDPNDPYSLSGDETQSFLQTRGGTVWVGTVGSGLNRFDAAHKRFIPYHHHVGEPTSLSQDDVRYLYQDLAGTVWIGTTAGLDRMDDTVGNGSFTHFTVADGLPNAVVYTILESPRGVLWLSTNNGLSRFDTRTKKFRNYNVYDGLQSNEFNTASGYAAPDGKLYFGGLYGLNGFYPDSIRDNPRAPPVQITEFRRFDHPEDLRRTMRHNQLVLSYRDNFISFDFAALSFLSPEKNRYAYRLEGFDPRWIDATARRSATYTNLPPGSYTFRVKAANNDGIWNEAGAAVPIVVTPPYWATRWFRTLALLTLLASIAAWYKWRVRSIEEHNRVLEETVLARTAEIQRQGLELRAASRRAGMAEVATGVLHNVGNVLNSVTVSASMLADTLSRSRVGGLERAVALMREQKDELGRFLTEDERGKQIPAYLGMLAETLQRENRDALEEVGRVTLGVDHIKRIVHAQQAHAKGADLTVRFNVVEAIEAALALEIQVPAWSGIRVIRKYPSSLLAFADRHQMTDILVNLLSNARQALVESRTPSPSVVISAAVATRDEAGGSAEVVQIRVTDNGHGIEAENLVKVFAYSFTTRPDGHGFGLHSAANAARTMHGDLTVSSPGKGHGATFTLELPTQASAQATALASAPAEPPETNMPGGASSIRRVPPPIPVRVTA